MKYQITCVVLNLFCLRYFLYIMFSLLSFRLRRKQSTICGKHNLQKLVGRKGWDVVYHVNVKLLFGKGKIDFQKKDKNVILLNQEAIEQKPMAIP